MLPVASKRTVEVQVCKKSNNNKVCTNLKFSRHFMQKQITLSNEGYGFGFLVSPGKGSGTVVESLIPNGVAWKVSTVKNDEYTQPYYWLKTVLYH